MANRELSAALQRVDELEGAAERVDAYVGGAGRGILHGLVQTPEYYRQTFGEGVEAEELEWRIAQRQIRQEVFFGGRKHLTMYISEAAFWDS